MSESVSLCACSTKGGMRAVSAMQHSLRGTLPSGTSFTAASTWFSAQAHAKVCRHAAGSIFQRAQANANAVACDTPTTLLAAFAENSSVASSISASTRNNAAAQVPILGTQLFGFTAGDEEGVPSQHRCVVVLLPRGMQAQQHRQVERRDACPGDAAYPLERADASSRHPAGLDGVFESLRKMKRADGQRRAGQVQQAQQLRATRARRPPRAPATAQPCGCACECA